MSARAPSSSSPTPREGLRADRIWFMEMNTRLQVEHPVTEAITGQDLVRMAVAGRSGEPLPKMQDEIAINGWAMEARLYAENPAAGFLPSTGRLEHLRLPQTVRVDTGVEQGDEITAFYDPMIAKLIAHGPNREAALAKLAAACAGIEVWPVRPTPAFSPASPSIRIFAQLGSIPAFSNAMTIGLVATEPSEICNRQRGHAAFKKHRW